MPDLVVRSESLEVWDKSVEGNALSAFLRLERNLDKSLLRGPGGSLVSPSFGHNFALLRGDRRAYFHDDLVARFVAYLTKPSTWTAPSALLQLTLEAADGREVGTHTVTVTGSRFIKYKFDLLFSEFTPALGGDYTLHAILVGSLVTDAERNQTQALYRFRVGAARPAAQINGSPVDSILEVPIELKMGGFPLAGPQSGGSWPISTGVPLPRGFVFERGEPLLVPSPPARLWSSLELVEVCEGRERVVPAQLTPRGHWQPKEYGGSVKWLGIDFIGRWSNAWPCAYKLRLRSGGGGAVTSDLSVHDDRDSIRVQNRYLKCDIRKRPFAGIDNVFLDPAGRGGPYTIPVVGRPPMAQGPAALSGPFFVAPDDGTDEANRTFAAALAEAPDSIAVEEESPVRVVIRATGWFHNSIGKLRNRYVTRMAFFSEQRHIEVSHRIILTESTNPRDQANRETSAVLRTAGWHVPIAFALPSTAIGSEPAIQPDRPSWYNIYRDLVYWWRAAGDLVRGLLRKIESLLAKEILDQLGPARPGSGSTPTALEWLTATSAAPLTIRSGPLKPDTTVSARQATSASFELIESHEGSLPETYRGTRFPGWIAALLRSARPSQSTSVSLAVRKFVELFPSELELSVGPLTQFEPRATVYTWPRRGRIEFPRATETEHQEIYKLRWCHHGDHLRLNVPARYSVAQRNYIQRETSSSVEINQQVEFGETADGCGIAISSDFAIFFHQNANPSLLASSAALYQLEPHALSPPSWNAATLAMGPAASADEIRDYDPAIATAIFRTLPEYRRQIIEQAGWPQPTPGEELYGRWIFGNLLFKWIDGRRLGAAITPENLPTIHRVWINTHHQSVSTAWLLYYLSGDFEQLTFARDHTKHVMDIATSNIAPDLGKMYHDRGFVPWASGPSPSHHFTDHSGLLLAHLIGGDRRARDVYDGWINNRKSNSPTRRAAEISAADRADLLPSDAETILSYLRPYQAAAPKLRDYTNPFGDVLDYYETFWDRDALLWINALEGLLEANQDDVPYEYPLWGAKWYWRYDSLVRDPMLYLWLTGWGNNVLDIDGHDSNERDQRSRGVAGGYAYLAHAALNPAHGVADASATARAWLGPWQPALHRVAEVWLSGHINPDHHIRHFAIPFDWRYLQSVPYYVRISRELGP